MLLLLSEQPWALLRNDASECPTRLRPKHCPIDMHTTLHCSKNRSHVAAHERPEAPHSLAAGAVWRDVHGSAAPIGRLQLCAAAANRPRPSRYSRVATTTGAVGSRVPRPPASGTGRSAEQPQSLMRHFDLARPLSVPSSLVSRFRVDQSNGINRGPQQQDNEQLDQMLTRTLRICRQPTWNSNDSWWTSRRINCLE